MKTKRAILALIINRIMKVFSRFMRRSRAKTTIAIGINMKREFSNGPHPCSVKTVADFVSEIAAASHEQTTGIDQVSGAITAMDEVTQQNATLVEETTTAIESAVIQVADLQQAVGFFKTAEQVEPELHSPDADSPDSANPPHYLHGPAMKKLAAGGGALAKMLPAFRWGLGGRLGSGRQCLSWITMDDVLRAVDFLLPDDSLCGDSTPAEGGLQSSLASRRRRTCPPLWSC